jgi:hypothetical protein
MAELERQRTAAVGWLPDGTAIEGQDIYFIRICSFEYALFMIIYGKTMPVFTVKFP